MSDILILIQVGGAVICLDMIAALFFRKQCAKRGTLLFVMTAVFVYNLMGVLTGVTDREIWHLAADVINMLAEICFFAGMWHLIAFLLNRPWRSWMAGIALGYSLALFAVRITDSKHHLYYKKFWMEQQGDTIVPRMIPGVFFYLTAASVILTVVVMFGYVLGICVKNRKKGGKKDRVKRRLLLLATFFPFISALLFLLRITSSYNPAPLSMVLESILMLIAINKYHLLNVVENARNMVIDTMDMGLVILDSDYNYLNSNAYASRIYPALADLEEGKSLLWAVPELAEFIQEKRTGVRKAEGRYYEYKVSEVCYEQKMRGYAVCINDVTERETYLEQQMEQKRQAELESERKSVFLANASHEIRTPMNVILGMSEICLQKSKNPEMSRVLEDIHSAGQSLLDTVNEILDFSKIEAGRMELEEAPYSLEKIMMEMYRMADGWCYGRPIEVFVNLQKNTPGYLSGDGTKIRMILSNLLGNACKYTEQGQIWLNTCWEQSGEGIQLVFEVGDTGIGIQEEEQGQIFDKYAQAGTGKKYHQGGTGLGLAITKSLVELMEGKITVTSQPGKGSTFTVFLPQKKTGDEVIACEYIDRDTLEAYRKKKEGRQQIHQTYPGIRALIVDDMQVNRQVAQGILAEYQITVDEAAGGRQALELQKEKTYDVIFLDQMMPEMNGIETLHHIRAEGKGEKVVALTAQGLSQEIRELKEHGFDSVLTKPIRREALEKVLEQLEDVPGLIQREAKNQKEHKNRQRILESYYHQVSELKEQLEGKLAENIEEFGILIHGIKGASRSIGARAVADQAKRLELAAKRKDQAYIARELPAWSLQLEKTLEEIAREIAQGTDKEPRPEGRLSQELLRELLSCLENFEQERLEELHQEMAHFSYAGAERELAAALGKDIRDLEYEQAIRKIKDSDIWKNMIK